MEPKEYDVCIVGGCGRVGLPLALCFNKVGKRVSIFDINEKSVQQVKSGKMPFHEREADEMLAKAVSDGLLDVTTSPEVISRSKNVIIILGTPVDSHLNPSFGGIIRMMKEYMPHFRSGQLVVLRSTVYPGTSEKVAGLIKDEGPGGIEVAFCPERIAEGYSMKETFELPQIISAFSETGLRQARELFSAFTDDVIELTPLEAELAKLFTNVWRYIKFSISNQFYSIANDSGLDYYRIHRAMTHNYPRAKDMPKAGLAAGPCLFKDTMQLAAYSNNSFFLGHAAMLVNEGQPAYIVTCLKKKYNLKEKKVGILGMAFKGDSDDPRESLAYKLRKLLEIECRQVLVSDPFVADERIIPADELIDKSDIVIIGAPHSAYREIDCKGKHVVDIWNILGEGGVI